LRQKEFSRFSAFFAQRKRGFLSFLLFDGFLGPSKSIDPRGDFIDVDVANVPFATAKHDCSSRVLLDYWP
jgi:hypothetical protein